MSYYPSSLRLNKIQQILVIKSKKHSKDIQKKEHPRVADQDQQISWIRIFPKR